MPIIHEFEEQNFKEGGTIPIINKKRYGNGFADIIPSISNIVSINKELLSNISNVAKTAGSVADASSKVTQAVKAAKELSQLREIKKNNEVTKQKLKKKDQSEISKILDEHSRKTAPADAKRIASHSNPKLYPKGDGFRRHMSES